MPERYLERVLLDCSDSEARVIYTKSPEGRRWGVVLKRSGEVTGLGYGKTLLDALLDARRKEGEYAD